MISFLHGNRLFQPGSRVNSAIFYNIIILKGMFCMILT
nr:MAG TPA: hypothetical protein [Caudoviricetes sp.]